MRKTTLFIIIGIITLLSSCKKDSYETGEGELSYLHADFTDITIQNGTVTKAITDDDKTLLLSSDTKYANVSAKDTIIRRLLYYTMPDEDATVKLYKSTLVTVVMPHDTSEVKTMLTDPVKLTSSWMSHNGKYINLQLGLMTGSSDDAKAKQALGLVCDSVSKAGKGAVHLTLYHDQAGYEQYYTQDVYLSIPLDSIKADTIDVSVNTYSGKQVKRFVK